MGALILFAMGLLLGLVLGNVQGRQRATRQAAQGPRCACGNPEPCPSLLLETILMTQDPAHDGRVLNMVRDKHIPHEALIRRRTRAQGQR